MTVFQFFAAVILGQTTGALALYWGAVIARRAGERRAAERGLTALDRLYAQHHEARTREKSFVKRFFDRRGR